MTDLPEGYIRHDGGPCPVPLDSKPGVIFADGMKYQPGLEPASLWALDNLRGDWWQHTSPNPDFNIIAYKPDPAFVEPGAVAEAGDAAKLLELENLFCAKVWDALKGDHTDLRKQAIILRAFRESRPAPADPVAQIVAGLRAMKEIPAPNDMALTARVVISLVVDWIERGDWKGTNDAQG